MTNKQVLKISHQARLLGGDRGRLGPRDRDDTTALDGMARASLCLYNHRLALDEYIIAFTQTSLNPRNS